MKMEHEHGNIKSIFYKPYNQNTPANPFIWAYTT